MKLEPEKILQRAEERLRLLPQSKGEETLHLLRGFLRVESHRLRMLHRFGSGGMEVSSVQSKVVDTLITHIYKLAAERFEGPKSGWRTPAHKATIVAVGGYGRGELCPYSDVDLLILYNKSSLEFAKFLAKEMVYLLWDIGLKVGHSWRTPDDCIEMARQDSTAENALIDARYLTGDAQPWEELQKLLHKHWTKNPHKFVERKIGEVEERYGRLGDTVFLQEPNLKESPGGMRDFHTMLWLARGAWLIGHFGELTRVGVLSPDDRRRAWSAYDTVMRMRNELHYLTGRRADQLTLALQPDVAANLKYKPQRHLLAAEVLMRDYFLHAENLHRAMRITMAAALREKGKKVRPVALNTALPLVRVEDEIRLAGEGEIFPNSPVEMMKAVNLAQQTGLRLGEDTKHEIRNNLATLRREWQTNPEMSREFVEILRRPGHVERGLRAMHSCGLLGQYLPEFAHATRLMQADYYHRFTVDEHTLRAIGLLDRLWTNPPASLARYQELKVHISDPAPLYLSLLLHDAGKGLGGNHSDKGAQRAIGICGRLGFSPEKTKQVETLIRQHLLLSHLSQRRDLSDRKVAQRTAAVLGSLETLAMLTMLTYADTSAVGPDTWTEWKNALLWELYQKVHDEYLDLETATAQENARLAEVKKRVESLLLSATPRDGDERPASTEAARAWIEEHLSLLPLRYPLAHRPEVVADQILLTRRAQRHGASVDLIPVPAEGYTLLLVCCKDMPGLFARLAGTLAALEINIMSARLDTRRDGMAVDIFWISTPAGTVISDAPRSKRIVATVEAVLKGETSFDDLVARIPVRSNGPAPKRPQISLTNEISEHFTVLEILAEDRLGFAYSAATCLTSLGCNIAVAKLSTEKTMVFDVFYITGADGKKLTEERWDEVGSALVQAASPGEAILPVGTKVVPISEGARTSAP